MGAVRPSVPASNDPPASAFEPLLWSDLSSWNGIGWSVALLIGVWGALMGVGQYYLADVFFGIAVLLFCAKWGHFTRIHNRNRRSVWFAAGILAAIVLFVVVVMWSRAQERSEEIRDAKLSQLNLIPGLQEQVAKIPELQQTISNLSQKTHEDADGLSRKQDTIEQLTSTVASQQKTIAMKTQQELSLATSAINQHIEQQGASIASNLDAYREDARSALAYGLLPERRLSPSQASALTQAIADKSCPPYTLTPNNPQEWKRYAQVQVNVLWVTDGEAAGYASDFINALRAGSGGTCGLFSLRTDIGVLARIRGTILASPDWSHPSPIAILIKNAFDQTHIPYVMLSQTPLFDDRDYGVTILIAANK